MPLPAPSPQSPGSPFSSWRANHVGIRYDDFDRAWAFWVDTLGWRPRHRWGYAHYTFAYLMPPTQDDFFIEILGGGEATAPAVFDDANVSLSVGGYNHVCFTVDDVDATVADLKTRGVEVIQPDAFDMPDAGARLAFFRDPWGNIFELAQEI